MKLNQVSAAGRLAVVLAACLGLVVMGNGLVLAQEGPGGDAHWATVTVTGTGRVSREAARAVVDTVVEGIGETPADAEEAVRSSFAAIREAVAALGYELVPGQFSLNPHWEYPPEGGAYQHGYEARRYIQIIVPDASRIGEALQELLNAGLTAVYNVSYLAGDPAEARAEAIRLALEDARQQAEFVALHSGLALGRIMTISVSDGWPGIYDGVGMASAQMEPSPVSVQVSVTVTYELTLP